MKRSMLAAMMLSLLATPAVAQWVNHKMPGIPRTKDGKPNLTAPAPRTADGKPDLSGLWVINGLGHATNLADADMLPEAQALYKNRLETYANDDPAAKCLPEGPRTGLPGRSGLFRPAISRRCCTKPDNSGSSTPTAARCPKT